jgi:hypothetical protein
MNCCNANGQCMGGTGCPVRPAKVATIARSSPKTNRTYTCDQLGICNCQGNTGCVNCHPPAPRMSIKERIFMGFMTVITVGALAGVAGFVWGVHGDAITRSLYQMANQLS